MLARESDPEHLRHLGVPELEGDRHRPHRRRSPQNPPSDLVVTGSTSTTPTFFEIIPKLEPSGRGDSSHDVNNWYVEQGTMEYDLIEASGATPASRLTPTTPSTTSCA